MQRFCDCEWYDEKGPGGPGFFTSSTMNEETLRKWMREIETRRASAGPPRLGPGGFFAGGGLALLILGGIAINSSLFTGALACLLLYWKLTCFVVDGGHRAIKYTR
jgi:hypothetical protein